ncbi:hypothetical protein [Portibacter lacus]|nr:hypothetical protein [Portibacter lacus]
MDHVLNSKDDRRAKIAAFIFALILLFLILYPFWSYTFPPPEKAGILVSFGEIEMVGGDDVKESQQEEVETPDDGEKEKKQSEVFQETEKQTPKKSAPETPVVVSKTAKQEVSEVVAKDEVSKKSVDAEKAKEDLAAQKAAAEAKKKADYEKAKKQFGDLLGKGTGKGNETGNAGDPNGDPNTNALKGISKGKGNIQGGLSDRGLMYEPEIEENSQKAGVVVVKVCVDRSGKVIEASYTQRGSTTTDTGLVKAAIDGSKRYRFSKSPIEKQCGTITIEFKLK